MKNYEIGNDTVKIEITEKEPGNKSNKDRFARYADTIRKKNREAGKNE